MNNKFNLTEWALANARTLKKQAEIEALKAKTLTDEEKWKLWGECPHGLVYDRVMIFADLILRKAQEK